MIIVINLPPKTYIDNMRHCSFGLIAVLFLIYPGSNAYAQMLSQSEARRIFIKSFGLVFGNIGASFDYNVKIAGLFSTDGKMVCKGRKSMYTEEYVRVWNNGETTHLVNTKKREVIIYGADYKSKYMSKFSFDNPDEFEYSGNAEGKRYVIKAKLKHSKVFGIRSFTAVVNKANLHPQQIDVKIAILTAHVTVSNFSSGNVNENAFVFPAERYRSYKCIDNR